MFPKAGGVGDGSVPKRGEAFDQLLIGDNAGLWQAIHATPDFHVDKTIVDKIKEFVVLDDLIWNDGKGEPHVLIACHGCAEVVILEIDQEMACTGRGDGTVDDQLGSGEVGRFSADVERVLDEVSADGEASTFRFGLLWTIVANDAAIGNGAIGRDVGVRDEENGVGAHNAVADALGEATQLV